MKKILDANDPFFKPIWRRWATSVFPLLWGGVEVYTGSIGWTILFLIAGVYALYTLIIVGPSTE